MQVEVYGHDLDALQRELAGDSGDADDDGEPDYSAWADDEDDYECDLQVGVQEFTGRSVGALETFHYSEREFELFMRPEKWFYRSGERFMVSTEGPDGQMADYQVSYVFGIRPLQQYLIAFPGGRYQCLPLCWDTRPASEGGQHWFHIYQQERIITIIFCP